MPKAEFLPGGDHNDGLKPLALRRRCEPTLVARGEHTGGFYAAKWTLPAHRIKAECQVDHILAYQVDGLGLASKSIGNRALHRHTHAGLITLIPSGEYAEYSVNNRCTWLEIYIAPRLIHRFAERNLSGGRVASLQPLFVVDDPWLSGYFKMLASELEAYGDDTPELDALMFGQAQELLFRHLLRCYSDSGTVRHETSGRSDRAPPLRPHLLRRVIDYIRANLASDLRLGDLAELAHLSENHFIRSFHAATGNTPYQYVVEQRLSAGAELLRADNALSIAAVAESLGFKSQANFATKFKTRYGLTPSAYRRKYGQ